MTYLHQACFLLVVTISLVITLGCQNDRPQGLPPLVHCEIELTQEGQPVEGVSIRLASDNKEMDKWPCGGTSDASGKAQLVTYGKYQGAPAGEYKIVLNKVVHEGGENDDENTPMNKRQAIKIYTLIDKKYNSEETTSLKLKVESTPVSQKFELGPKTKTLIDTIKPGVSM